MTKYIVNSRTCEVNMNHVTIQNLAYRKVERTCCACGMNIPIYNWLSRLQHEIESEPPEPIPSTIQFRYSRSFGGDYWANICPYCDTLQGDHFIHNIERRFENEYILQRDELSPKSRINDGEIYSMYDDIQLQASKYLYRNTSCSQCDSQAVYWTNHQRILRMDLCDNPCSTCLRHADNIERKTQEFNQRMNRHEQQNNIRISKILCFDTFEEKKVHRDVFFTLYSKKENVYFLCKFSRGWVSTQSSEKEDALLHKIFDYLREKRFSIVLPWTDFKDFRNNRKIQRQYRDMGVLSPYRMEKTLLRKKFDINGLDLEMDLLQYFYDNYLLSAPLHRDISKGLIHTRNERQYKFVV